MTKLKKLRDGAISVAALSSSLIVVIGPVANASDVAVSTQGIVGTGIRDTSTQGIVGTGIRDTSTQGIVGTGIRDTSTQGIVGTGIRDTSTQGIVGTGIRDTSTQGIVGTGIRNTSTHGIVGTGIRGKLDLSALNADVVDSGLPIVAYGPVEQVVEGGYLILGQLVSTVDQASQVTLNVGDTAIVLGFVSDDGIVTDRIVKALNPLVQGSSPVFIAGIVEESDPARGSYTIGALTVEVGAAGTSAGAFTVQPGQYVEVIGVEFNGLLLAENIEADNF